VSAHALVAGHGSIPVVRGLDLEVHPGEVVALLGPNGAGKTTTVLTLAGELPPLGGRVLANGQEATDPLHKRARDGLAYVGEERSVFMQMTVAENLRVAKADARRAYAIFPELKPLAPRRTGLLSGGEQQMLSLARVLARPITLLLADELSLGLAPLVVDRLLDVLRRAAHEDGVGVLVVEQHVEKALHVADYVYVMRRGELAMQGTAAQIRSRTDELHAAYLSA
jgi:ABC-type branched-subunit amino acid transport system ATPase component